MKQLGKHRRRLIKYSAYLLGVALLGFCLFSIAPTKEAASDSTNLPAWATPSVTALKHVGPLPDVQNESNLLNNVDCSSVEYRLVNSQGMRTGCFTETAFGLFDSDSEMAIFNGTDEGLPLLPYWPDQALVAWPDALDLIALSATPTGGSYIGLYKDPLASLQDQRDAQLQLKSKKLTAIPELPLKDPDGQQLVVNPETMAFSDGGSWLVVETLSGSFVRINLATLDVTAFAPEFTILGNPALLKSQVAVSDDGRYVAIANDNAASLKVYDLASCDGVVDDLKPQSCTSYDYWPFVRQQVTGFQSVDHLRFVNDSLLSFETQTGNKDSSGVYELAPKDSISSLIDYLGLGDSYTSGEGAFDYISGTDTADNTCHLSIHSYPLLLTHDLSSSTGGHSVACSGAVINDIGSTNLGYQGQVRGAPTLQQLQQTQSALLSSIMTNYLPGYVAQQQFVKQYQPAVVTVSIGGNDIGFGDIIENCVAPHISLHPSDNTCYNTYEDRLELTNLIDRTVPRWTALYRQLLAESPGTRVYAIGYPEIAVDTGNCALNVHLNKSEIEFANELVNYLDDSISQAANEAGVNYVDISQALAGHRLCETTSYDSAVNGLTAGKDSGALGIRVFGKESYHPNALGQALIEQSILKQTHNLAGTTSADVNVGEQDILAAPKTGRIVNTIVPDDSLTTGLATIGQVIEMKASGADDGLRPETTYTIRLDGANGQVISTVTSDDTGDISSSVTLPDSTSPGGHTIDVTGENQVNEPIDVTQPIYAADSDNDADGDGVPDVIDTCPGAINSGQDDDRDGIDDTCDGSIGPVSSGGSTGTLGSGQADISNNQGGDDINNQTGGVSVGNGAGITGVTLGTPASIIVKSFAVRYGQTTNNVREAARVLGSATTNPATVATKTFKPSGKVRLIDRQESFTKLRIFNWLPWIILAIVTWLLTLLGLYVKYFAKRLA